MNPGANGSEIPQKCFDTANQTIASQIETVRQGNNSFDDSGPLREDIRQNFRLRKF